MTTKGPAERAEAEAKLKTYQNSDGAFPWFPGGHSDPYMTLLVLSGWAADVEKANGGRVLSKDEALVEWSETVRNVFVKDPNGLNLELVGAADPNL